MKKFLKIMIALVFMAIPCLSIASACSLNVDFSTVKCDLNGGSYTEEYKTEKGITSDNWSMGVNLNNYGGFSDGLPDERDITAPAGKVFAGWYLDKECSAENYLTSRTWEVLAEKVREKKGGSVIYARWIDAGTKEIIFELDDESLSYSGTNARVKRVTVTSENYTQVLEEIPTSANIVMSNKKVLAGWKVECNGHYYDLQNKTYNENVTNSTYSFLNYDVDATLVNNFAASTDVSYVLVRPKVADKPTYEIKLDMSDGIGAKVTYDDFLSGQRTNGSYVTFNLITTCDYIAEDDVSYATGISFGVVYDIGYEALNNLLPSGDYLTSDATGKTWYFSVNSGEKQVFNQANWQTYSKTYPSSDSVVSMTFTLE